MIGERIFPDRYGGLRLPDGAFGRDLRGRWWCRPPGESARRPLDGKVIIEYPDGTVTVRGMINGGARAFTLQAGVWEAM